MLVWVQITNYLFFFYHLLLYCAPWAADENPQSSLQKKVSHGLEVAVHALSLGGVCWGQGRGNLWGLLILVLIPEKAGLTAELPCDGEATSVNRNTEDFIPVVKIRASKSRAVPEMKAFHFRENPPLQCCMSSPVPTAKGYWSSPEASRDGVLWVLGPQWSKLPVLWGFF